MHTKSPVDSRLTHTRHSLVSPPTVFDGALMCSDCMENSSSYSKDPDYLAHGFGPAGGSEYQQHPAPPPYPHCHSGEQHDSGPHSTSLCNGTPNGIRKEVKEFPKNHNLLQQNQHDKKGESGALGACDTADGTFHMSLGRISHAKLKVIR